MHEKNCWTEYFFEMSPCKAHSVVFLLSVVLMLDFSSEIFHYHYHIYDMRHPVFCDLDLIPCLHSLQNGFLYGHLHYCQHQGRRYEGSPP